MYLNTVFIKLLVGWYGYVVIGLLNDWVGVSGGEWEWVGGGRIALSSL